MKNEKRLRSILKEIRAFCADHASRKQADKYARYFNEGYDPYGVPDADMKPRREKWLAENRDLGLGGFLDLGDLLFENGKYEEASCAVVFAAAFKDQFKPATLERFARWLDTGVRNWAHCDAMSGNLLSPFLVEKIVPLKAFASWRNAESRWRRRSVPVSMLPLLKHLGSVQPLLDFLDPMMNDSERVVHQGLGWFLREAWKVQPKSVERFLLRRKDTSARLIFQYATEKMTPVQRHRFRAGPGQVEQAR